jgi:hypothetical protein
MGNNSRRPISRLTNKAMSRILILFFAALCLLPIGSQADWLFGAGDPLAARDGGGLLHQTAFVNRTDLAPRYSSRFEYYFMSGQSLMNDPAYVGALQSSLYRYGYYCGPIDGVFSDEVSAAIARLQKNSSQTVTGTLTLSVRRVLHLP